VRAAGKAHAAQRLFWRWKLRRPHLTQRVWVLFLLLPKLPVPFPYTHTKSKHHQNQIGITSTENKRKNTYHCSSRAETLDSLKGEDLYMCLHRWVGYSFIWAFRPIIVWASGPIYINSVALVYSI